MRARHTAHGEKRISDISFNQSEDYSYSKEIFSKSQPAQDKKIQRKSMTETSMETPESPTKVTSPLPKIQLAPVEEHPKRDFKLVLPKKFEVPRAIAQLRASPTPRTASPSPKKSQLPAMRLRLRDNADIDGWGSRTSRSGSYTSRASADSESEEEFFPAVASNSFSTNFDSLFPSHDDISQGIVTIIYIYSYSLFRKSALYFR